MCNADRPPATVARSAASELGRLRIVRNCLTKANPWLCARCPDIQHRLKLRRIVQRRETDGHHFWSSLATAQNRGEPQSEQKLRVASLPLLARTEYVFGVPVIVMSDTRTMKPEAKGAPLERWQSRQWQLSVATGAREHTPADRSACTPAGKWSSHIAVSSCRLTHFHWHLTDALLKACYSALLYRPRSYLCSVGLLLVLDCTRNSHHVNTSSASLP